MSFETLASQSRIWLFGRVLDDLRIVSRAYSDAPTDEVAGNLADTPPLRSKNNFLLEQIKAEGAALARIYSFSYEATFHDLARPAIFLVHGDGIEVEGAPFGLSLVLSRASRMPAETGRSGLGSLSGSFADGIRVWAYDRADFTLRLDVDGGSFDTLLLCTELGDDPDPAFRSAGSVVRSAGSVARSAGSVVRSAGSVARARGGSGSRD